MRTFQLRRYELQPELFDEFVAWVIGRAIPIRESMGFRVEWKYVDRENSQFIWCVSVEGSEADFEEVDHRYHESAERAAAAATVPKALIKAHVSFVAVV